MWDIYQNVGVGTSLVMPSGVTDELQNGVQSFQTQALGMIGTIIPIALLLTISVAVVYFIVRHFRSISHV